MDPKERNYRRIGRDVGRMLTDLENLTLVENKITRGLAELTIATHISPFKLDLMYPPGSEQRKKFDANLDSGMEFVMMRHFTDESLEKLFVGINECARVVSLDDISFISEVAEVLYKNRKEDLEKIIQGIREKGSDRLLKIVSRDDQPLTMLNRDDAEKMKGFVKGEFGGCIKLPTRIFGVEVVLDYIGENPYPRVSFALSIE